MDNYSKWIRTGSLGGPPLALLSLLVVAGSNSTTLPNGAELQVSIDDPVTSTEFKVPANQTTINVPVMGTASIGLGEPDATFVYTMDVSGSTNSGSGTGCAPVLDCEQKFIKALNQAVISDGSSDEVGVVVYATSGATADMQAVAGDQIITLPDAGPGDIDTIVDSTFSAPGGVSQFTNKPVGIQTNCTDGLVKALDVVNASTNGTNIVVLVSDGLCDDSGGGGLAGFNDAINALAGVGAVVNTVATGTGSSCNDSEPGFDGTLQGIADGTGGTCFEVEDPGNLPDIIPSLIGSTLESLEISVDGGATTPIPNSEISCDLPEPGAVLCSYQTTVMDLGPGDHEICVTASGSDITGGTADVTQCETIHLLQLSAAPLQAENELGSDNEHTVTATLLGDPGQIAGRKVDFNVTGQNPTTEAQGSCTPNADCTTDAGGQVSFSYMVPIEPDSLGMDTITVSTSIAGMLDAIDLEKTWVDTTPPVAACVETVNPHGKNIPQAPGTGQNEDGFYQLSAMDDTWPADSLEVFVTDIGSGTVFGPFAVGDNIKYTQAGGAKPSSKPMGSGNGQAGAVLVHIKGNGDAELTAVDGAGNESDPSSCLVPRPPK